MNAADYMRIADALAGVVSNALQARAEARKLAAASGVSEADLDAADARFQKAYDDPLKVTP